MHPKCKQLNGIQPSDQSSNLHLWRSCSDMFNVFCGNIISGSGSEADPVTFFIKGATNITNGTALSTLSIKNLPTYLPTTSRSGMTKTHDPMWLACDGHSGNCWQVSLLYSFLTRDLCRTQEPGGSVHSSCSCLTTAWLWHDSRPGGRT